MSSSDSNPDQKTSAEVSGRLIALDKWLAQRIEEAAAAETKLAKRLECLARAEDGLKALLDALRTQTAESAPILSRLTEFATAANAAANDVLSSAQSMHERIVEKVRSGSEQLRQTEQSITAALARIEQQALEALGPAEQAIWRAVHEAKTEAHTIAQVLPQRIADQMKSLEAGARQTVESATQRVNKQVEAIENKTSNLDKWLEQQTLQIMERVAAETRAEALAAEHAWQERIHKQMAEHERRAKSLCDLMQQKLEAFQASTNDMAAMIERLLREAMQGAKASAQGKTRALRAEIETLFASLRSDLQRAALDFQKQSATAAHDLRASLQAELAQELDVLKAESLKRAEEIRHAGRSMAEQVEEELVRRVRSLRPIFNRELEAAEKLLAERLTHAAAELESTLEMREAQLAARLDDLRPRAAAVWRSVEAELAAKSAALEHEANTMTSFLERRLSQRVDELVQRTRRVLQRTIAQADSTTAADNPSPTPEFQFFVDRAKLRTEGAAQTTTPEAGASAA